MAETAAEVMGWAKVGARIGVEGGAGTGVTAGARRGGGDGRSV